MSLTMRTGDLEPDLEVTIRPARTTDPPVNLTTAASVRVIGKQLGEVIFDRAPTSTVVDGNNTVVTMEWQAGDTALPNRITIEIEATWPGTRPQTFVPDGGVDIRRDFDYVDA